MSAWPTAASRRLELFSAFSGNPDGFVCLVYIALHCSAICKRDQCWLPLFQSLWHHHHLIPIMGEKKPLPSSSCWVWEGQWGTLCACTLNQQDERYWHSHDTALLGQDTISKLFPGLSCVPMPTMSAVTFLYRDDHGFPGISKMARLFLAGFMCFSCHLHAALHHVLLKGNELMHDCLRTEKLHWRY